MRDYRVLELLLERVQRTEKRLAAVRRAEADWIGLTATGTTMLDVMATWIRDQVAAMGRDGALVGVSGGVDSTVAAIATQRAVGDKGLALILPDTASDPKDQADAIKLCELLKLPYQVIPVGPGLDALLGTMGDARSEARKRPVGNLASRVRMSVQFYVASVRNYLVVGPGDMDEVYIGYSSKGLAADVYPITGLHKDEVRGLAWEALSPLDETFAKYMSERPATPGFWPGQRAEQQLGMPYSRIGPAVEIMANHCTLQNQIIFPEDV
ncbi:MAG TPA: NAD(+) synthase, partial [Candidatus Xenobia bacterium]